MANTGRNSILLPTIDNYFLTSIHKKKDIEIDAKELDTFLTFILNKLSELYPQVSRELTKKTKVKKGLNKLERKKFKIELLLNEKRPIFDKLSIELNKSFGSSKGPLDYSSSNFFDSVYFLVKAEPVSGSYGSKYGHGQGPIEE